MTEEMIIERGCIHCSLCSEDEECYLNRCKRLEQENEKLKKEVKQIGSDFIKKGDYARELEQENKELKIYIESNKQQVEEVEILIMDNDRLQQEVENLKDTIYYDVEKYRSALEEIREIEELAYYSKGMPEEPLSQRDFILHAINDYEQRRIKILTKINEVLQ